MATLPGLAVNLTLQNAQFVAGIRQANQHLSSLDRAAKTASTAIKGMAAGLAGLALGVGIGGLIRIGKQALDTADQLHDLSKQTGISIGALQSLQRQAEVSGSSAEQLNAGLLAMTRGVGQLQAGTGRLASQLEHLDPVLAAQLKTVRDQETALDFVAEALERAGTEAERQAISIAVFGEAGRELGVAFSEGAEGIARARERDVAGRGLVPGGDDPTNGAAMSSRLRPIAK
jgi:uncharacterized phage infection (PIP) family protein YhgE